MNKFIIYIFAFSSLYKFFFFKEKKKANNIYPFIISYDIIGKQILSHDFDKVYMI